MLCPVPGTRIVAFLPTASAAAVPPGHLSDVPVVEVRALHGSVPFDRGLRDLILATVTGGPLPHHDLTTYSLVQRAAAGWQAPPLPLALVPAWRPHGHSRHDEQPRHRVDAAMDDADGCAFRP